MTQKNPKNGGGLKFFGGGVKQKSENRGGSENFRGGGVKQKSKKRGVLKQKSKIPKNLPCGYFLKKVRPLRNKKLKNLNFKNKIFGQSSSTQVNFFQI